jgi:hypothetical protein
LRSEGEQPQGPRIWWSPSYGVFVEGPDEGWVLPMESQDFHSQQLPADAVPYRPAVISAHVELAHAAGAQWPNAKPPRVWWSAERGGLIVGNAEVDQAECQIPPDAQQYALMPEPDPDLIRWCDFPDCLASFHAVRGPRENGWRYLKNRGVGGSLLVCPLHAPSPHLIKSRDWKPGDDRVTVECGCGESASVWPTTGAAIRQWWECRVRTVDRP